MDQISKNHQEMGNTPPTTNKIPKSTSPEEAKAAVLNHIRRVELESAVAVMKAFHVALSASDFELIIESFKTAAECERSKGEIRSANRLDRRKKAVEIFLDHGLDPKRLVPPVILSEGYVGKILLMAISGGVLNGWVCLRSGGDWHREILTDTQEEIQDQGFENALVDPVGGAFVRFEANGSIEVYGISDEFGGCDKQTAASLIRLAFPERRVIIGR
jgi:hypothetical protein